MKKRKGFTLVELVIVVAIIGILALMVIPKFNSVTQDAKNRQWESNCETVVSAIAMYQAGHNGDFPATPADLDTYLTGGWAALEGPDSASYTLNGGEHMFTSEYPEYTGDNPAFAGGSYTYE